MSRNRPKNTTSAMTDGANNTTSVMTDGPNHNERRRMTDGANSDEVVA